MKNSVLVVAIAGVMTTSAALADTTVYGRLSLGETYSDPRSDDGDSSWDVVNYLSRIGFKGSEDLGNGLSAIYQYEFGVDASDTASIGGTSNGGRLAFVGLKGGWGSATIGRQWNDAFFVGNNGDFGINTYEDDFQLVRNFNSNSVGFWNRQGDMLKYMAPTFGGVTLAGNIITNGDSGESGIDEYTLSARAEWGNFEGGLYWNQIGSDVAPGPSMTAKIEGENQDTYGIGAKYFMQSLPLTFNAAYNRTDNGGEGADKRDAANWHAGVTWGLPGSNDLYLHYENHGESNAQADDGSSFWALQATHRFSKRTRVLAVYANWDSDPNYNITQDENRFTLAMRHDF